MNNWLKIIFLSLFTLVVASGIFYAGYRSGLQQATTPLPATPTPLLPTPTPDPTAGWKTYTNTEYKYSMKIPSNWGIISALTGEVLPELTGNHRSELIGDGEGFPPQAIETEVKLNSTKDQFLKEYKGADAQCRETEENKILCDYTTHFITHFLIQKGRDLYVISDVRGLSNFDLILSTFEFLE